MSYVDISVAQMQDFMDALGFRELSVEERSSKYPSGAIRVVKERVFTRPLGEGEIRVYSSVTGQTSRAKGRDAIRVQYWVDGVKVAGTTRVHRVENWRRNLLNRVYELENLVNSGYLSRVPRDSTGTPMVVRKAKRTGKKFWGSSLFPKNNETRRLDAEFMEIPELMDCPWCGADDIQYEGSLENGTQEVQCNSCGGTWYEIWKFVGYELLSGEFAAEVWSATPYPYL